MKYSWILKNRLKEYRDKPLSYLVKKNKHFVNDIDEFANCIAIAFIDQLSKMINQRVSRHCQTLLLYN